MVVEIYNKRIEHNFLALGDLVWKVIYRMALKTRTLKVSGT